MARHGFPLYTEQMQLLTSTRGTCRLILISLFPEQALRIITHSDANDTTEHYKSFYTIIEKKIPPHLHHPDTSGLHVETVRLFFPHTHAMAAPFILFRMKRRGFSSSRVTVQNGGLLLTATR